MSNDLLDEFDLDLRIEDSRPIGEKYPCLSEAASCVSRRICDTTG
ncbi:hypothetical protein [Kribbella ginsengisoli]